MTDLLTTQDTYRGLRTVYARPLVQPVARDLEVQTTLVRAKSILDAKLDAYWDEHHTLPSTEERNAMRDAAWIESGVTHDS